MAKAEQIMKALTEKGMNWIDAQFIKTAVEALKQARSILAVSYIMGYFLPVGTHVELFENYQGFMEEATEKLSQVLEDKKNDSIIDRRLDVINLTENLKYSSPSPCLSLSRSLLLLLLLLVLFLFLFLFLLPSLLMSCHVNSSPGCAWTIFVALLRTTHSRLLPDTNRRKRPSRSRASTRDGSM